MYNLALQAVVIIMTSAEMVLSCHVVNKNNADLTDTYSLTIAGPIRLSCAQILTALSS